MTERESNFGNPDVFYESFYNEILCLQGAAAGAMRRTHAALELGTNPHLQDLILEVGAGNAEHFRFVKPGFTSYTMLDIRPINLPSDLDGDCRIRLIQSDAKETPFESDTFDRVIVTCLLHHLDDPEKALTEWRRVVKPGGKLTIFISCDPGLAVRVLRALTTARKAKKLGFQGYGLMIAREHRNHFSGLYSILRFVFRHDGVKVAWHPFRIRSWNVNGFVVVTIVKR